MTKSNVHAILGDLHRLLSTYNAVDFKDASSYRGIPRAMRHALIALSREAEPAPANANQRTKRVKAKLGATRKKATGTQTKGSDVLHLLRRSAHFRSTASMLHFARTIGLKIDLRPKEGRERLARRVAALIDSLPESKKNLVLNDLVSGRNDQTQGWLEIIKSTNH